MTEEIIIAFAPYTKKGEWLHIPENVLEPKFGPDAFMYFTVDSGWMIFAPVSTK